MEVELTNFELFKSFTGFEKEGIHIDLHNEFDCNAIEYSREQKQFKLSFKPNAYYTQNVKNVEVIFEDCCIQNYSAKHDGVNADLGTIDLMYRGRFELSSEQLSETLNGRYYYYINLLPNTNFELFARRVTAISE
jgi:hypothetical protein